MSLDAVLLAAGRGERLRPLTDTVPKPALDVAGAPLGAWGLAALAGAGLRTAVNVSHLGTKIAAALRPYDPGLTVLDEGPEPFGTAGTLREYRHLFGPLIVTHNADLLCDLDIRELLTEHARGGGQMTVAVREVDDGADLIVDGDRAVGFVDRRREPERSGMRYLGIATIDTRALELIPPAGPRGMGECLIAPLARQGEIGVVVHRGYALDVGTPERLEQAREDVRTGRIEPPVRRTWNSRPAP
jgi:NDP-sugar pyrophosphorylase family protein